MFVVSQGLVNLEKPDHYNCAVQKSQFIRATPTGAIGNSCLRPRSITIPEAQAPVLRDTTIFAARLSILGLADLEHDYSNLATSVSVLQRSFFFPVSLGGICELLEPAGGTVEGGRLARRKRFWLCPRLQLCL